MLRVEFARWDQTPADLRELAMSASHRRTRERFLALYEITQESCATRIAERTHRHPQTVMAWLHLYNTGGPEALTYQRTGPPSHDGVDCQASYSGFRVAKRGRWLDLSRRPVEPGGDHASLLTGFTRARFASL